MTKISADHIDDARVRSNRLVSSHLLGQIRITDEEVQSLHQVIGALSDYIRRTAPGPEAMELLLWARQMVGVTSRQPPHFIRPTNSGDDSDRQRGAAGNFARGKGITSMTNPAPGIKGNPEPGRDAYIEDAVYKVVWKAAEEPLQDAMDLAYLTGQRPADVLKLSSTDIQDGELTVVQNKTGKRLRIAVEGELAAAIERIKGRKVAGMTLITRQGKPMTKAALRGAFDRARDAAVKAHPEMEAKIRAFQFRDLRAKAGTDTEQTRGMAAAKDQLEHSSETMTAHYVRHRRGKLVKPTK